MKLKINFALGGIFLMALLNTACHRKTGSVPETMLTGKVTIAADEALAPVMNAELDVFHSIYSYASVDCKYVSEYDAINLLLQEKIRLAIVARPLNQKESDFFKTRNIIPESIPLAYDAVAIVVNPANNTERLSTAQVVQLLSGTITDWDQLHESGKSGTIRLVFDAQSSGIIRSLNDSLNLNKKIAGTVSFSGNSKNVIDKVASDPNAIGFVGFNWFSEEENPLVQQRLKEIKLLAVSKAIQAGRFNSYKPSTATIFNRQYPLIRKIYAVYTDPSAGLSRGFLAELTSERGQKIIYRMGLKPADDFQRLVTIKKNY